jgi:hypothetical protein
MGFYGPVPFDTAEAIYLWTGLGAPGFFAVTVKGNARNFTTGITLVRDPQWVGGLAIKVMGWTARPRDDAIHGEGYVPRSLPQGYRGDWKQ